jgi:dTDP-4-amino-4,6-dideoxygalactose transaminase
MKPQLPPYEKLKPFLERIDESNIYSNFGPLSWELRTAYAEYFNVDPELIIPIANATLAIQGCLEILEQKNWLIPDYTFAATAHAAVSARKSVSVLDVSLDDFQIDVPDYLNSIEYGIIPVMPFGANINFKNWLGFDGLVIDAAASLGAPPPNFSEMPKDSMVVYSLHATKVLGAGEGALVICENPELANQLRSWSNFGFGATRTAIMVGANAKMSEYSCAVALASILDFKVEKEAWEAPLEAIRTLQLPERYRTIVDSYPGFRPYWIIQVENLRELNHLASYLNEHEIGSQTWWGTPITRMPAFRHLSILGDRPNANYLSESHLGLPIWKGISLSELAYIEESLNSFQDY